MVRVGRGRFMGVLAQKRGHLLKPVHQVQQEIGFTAPTVFGVFLQACMQDVPTGKLREKPDESNLFYDSAEQSSQLLVTGIVEMVVIEIQWSAILGSHAISVRAQVSDHKIISG